MAEVPKSLQTSLDNSKAHYRNLGKSGLKVSIPIYGCMSFGHKDWLPWVTEEKEVRFWISKTQLQLN